MDFEFNDNELGVITIERNARARRLIFKPNENGIKITAPSFSGRDEIIRVFNENRHKLIGLRSRFKQRPALVNGTSIDMFDFKIVLRESLMGNTFEARFSNDVLEFVSPRDTDYTNAQVQNFYKKNIAKVLRHKADNYLPARINKLAVQIGVKYNNCEVSYGKSRLGCCDSKGNIRLSYRLMMYPGEIIDFVILHELAHLKEMNHGENFHKLLNSYCNGQELELDHQLKSMRFPF